MSYHLPPLTRRCRPRTSQVRLLLWVVFLITVLTAPLGTAGMDVDGKNVEPIGHLNLGGALHPAVLKDGRGVFSSAEHQGLRGRHYGARHLWGIWAIHPDGAHWQPVISAFSQGEACHFVHTKKRFAPRAHFSRSMRPSRNHDCCSTDRG